ncbi:hypothetical protein [Porphyromonas gingivalis]|uniref:hypothetical protein n=1 Tax=Porphyromonas gingivalis TaxID=837 RepID=UPI0035270B16
MSRAKSKKITRVFSAKHEQQSSISLFKNSFRPHSPFILFVPLAETGGQRGKRTSLPFSSSTPLPQ